MTQIIEFTKHLDKYLIHHFDFECNDNTTIGNFAGNCSLNKFMSLHDWHQIFDNLNETIQNYAENFEIKPAPSQCKIGDTNFQLNIEWMELDASFYSKLLNTLDFSCVFPYVIKVNVTLRSNIDKFFADESMKLPIQRTPAKDRKKVSKKRSKKSESLPQPVITNGAFNNGVEIKECRVILPMLQLDKNGQIITNISNNGIRRKRKRSSLENDEPNNELFMCSSSSTPLLRNMDVELNQIENIIRDTYSKTKKRSTNRLTTTPRSSNERKSGSKFHPRIRLLKMPDSVNKSETPKSSKSKDMKGKRAVKVNGKVKKKLKQKVRSVPNESDLFETPTQNKKPKKNMTKSVKDKSVPEPIMPPSDQIKLDETDLKSLTEPELWHSFDEHYEVISSLFSDYLKQTDQIVQKADDYNHFDVLSLLTTDQFSIMLDILFDKLVKIGECGEINYDALFLELLIPEWVLAIFMRRHSIGRRSAIDRITSRKSDQSNQSYEGLTTLISIKLDETTNSTPISKTITID